MPGYKILVKPTILFLFLLIGCIKEIDLTTQGSPPQPVLSAIINNDPAFPGTVRFTYSTAPTKETINIPIDGRVSFYQNENLIEEYPVDSLGYAPIPNSFPNPGNAFSIIAQSNTDAPLVGVDTMPEQSLVFNASFQSTGLIVDGFGVDRATVRFSDRPLERNYYEIQFAFITVSTFGTPTTLVNFFNDPHQLNSILLNEGNQEFEPESFFFSDELFDGQNVNFEVLLLGGTSGGGNFTGNPYGIREEGFYVIFRNISRKYYEYLKAWTKHRYTRVVGQGISDPGNATFEDFQNLIFAPEPFPMVSTVTNGLGIIGAANTQIIKMD